MRSRDTRRKPASLLDALVTGAVSRGLPASAGHLVVAAAEGAARLRRARSSPSSKWTFPERLAVVERLPARRSATPRHTPPPARCCCGWDDERSQRHLEFALTLAPDNVQATRLLGMLCAQQTVRTWRQHLQQAAGGSGATAQTHYPSCASCTRADSWRAAAMPAQMRRADRGGAAPGHCTRPGVCRGVCRAGTPVGGPAGSGNELFALQQKAIALSPGREDYMLNWVLPGQPAAARRCPNGAGGTCRWGQRRPVKSGAADLLKRIPDFERRMSAGASWSSATEGPRVFKFDFRRGQGRRGAS